MTSQKTPFVRPEFSPLSVARMLWKRKLLIVVIWFSVGLTAAVVVSRLTPSYYAEALIMVDSQKIPEKYVDSAVSSNVQDRLAAITSQILSSARLKKMIADFNLYPAQSRMVSQEELLSRLRNDIKVNVERAGERTNAFRVGYIGRDPAITAQVANRLANFYVEENLKTREVLAEGTSEFLEAQLQEAKRKLDGLEAALSRYKVRFSGELPQQENALAGTLGRLQVELQANNDALRRVQENKVVLQAALTGAEAAVAALQQAIDAGRPLPAVTLPEAPVRPPKRSEALIAQLEQLQLRYSDEHPDIVRLKNEIARVQGWEEQQERGLAAAPPAAKPAPAGRTPRAPAIAPELAQARERASTLKTQIGLADKEIVSRRAEHERIRGEMLRYQSRIEKLPLREQEMASITRDYEISKANYQNLLGKKISAEMATDMEKRQKSERFTLLDPARMPEKPFEPKVQLWIILASLGGLGIAAAVAMGVEMRSGVLLGEWELPANTPVLGRLPFIDITPSEAFAGIGPGLAGRVAGWKTRYVLLSSVLVSLLGVILAGLYFAVRRS